MKRGMVGQAEIFQEAWQMHYDTSLKGASFKACS